MDLYCTILYIIVKICLEKEVHMYIVVYVPWRSPTYTADLQKVIQLSNDKLSFLRHVI